MGETGFEFAHPDTRVLTATGCRHIDHRFVSYSNCLGLTVEPSSAPHLPALALPVESRKGRSPPIAAAHFYRILLLPPAVHAEESSPESELYCKITFRAAVNGDSMSCGLELSGVVKTCAFLSKGND